MEQTNEIYIYKYIIAVVFKELIPTCQIIFKRMDLTKFMINIKVG